MFWMRDKKINFFLVHTLILGADLVHYGYRFIVGMKNSVDHDQLASSEAS